MSKELKKGEQYRRGFQAGYEEGFHKGCARGRELQDKKFKKLLGWNLNQKTAEDHSHTCCYDQENPPCGLGKHGGKIVSFKVGDIVKWKCKPFGHKEFIARGIIKKFGKSCFGGSRAEKRSVKVETLDEYRYYFPNRHTTVIALAKLINNVVSE